MVELDVRRTADGQLAIHHDAHLPDGRAVCDVASGDLPSDIPSLAEAIDACEAMRVNVEVKSSARDPDFDPTRSVAADVAAIVGSRGLYDRILVSSFDVGSIGRVREVDSLGRDRVADDGRARQRRGRGEPRRRGPSGPPPVRPASSTPPSSTRVTRRASR